MGEERSGIFFVETEIVRSIGIPQDFAFFYRPPLSREQANTIIPIPSIGHYSMTTEYYMIIPLPPHRQ